VPIITVCVHGQAPVALPWKTALALIIQEVKYCPRPLITNLIYYRRSKESRNISIKKIHKRRMLGKK
jgi:hypothetical protein